MLRFWVASFPVLVKTFCGVTTLSLLTKSIYQMHKCYICTSYLLILPNISAKLFVWTVASCCLVDVDNWTYWQPLSPERPGKVGTEKVVRESRQNDKSLQVPCRESFGDYVFGVLWWQVLMAYSTHLSLSFYATLCIASCVAVFFLPIETKGRALQVSSSELVFNLRMLFL